MKKHLIFLLLILVSTLPLVFPILQKGYPKTDDGIWAVVRLAEMDREVKDLQFPPRWSSFLNHGFGYPLFLFTYPFPYYVGEVLHLLGFSLVMTLKLLFIISIAGSGVVMYLLSQKWWGRWGGLLAGVAYLYVPYRLLNLYVRGSIGELLASIFYPLLFFSGYIFVTQTSVVALLTTSVLLATLILTHNASALLFLPFWGGWMLFLLLGVKNKVQAAFSIAAALFLGFGLSAYFWLPAMLEKKYIALGMKPLADKTLHFLSLPVFLGLQTHPMTEFHIMIGTFHLILFLIALLAIFFLKPKLHGKQAFYMIVGSFLVSIFLLFPGSFLVWQLPVLKEIDFPWRMLGVSTFLLSFGIGILGNYKKSYFVVIPLVLLIIFFSLPREVIVRRLFEPDSYYASNDATTTSADELMPIGVVTKPTNRLASKVTSSSVPLSVSHVIETSKRFSFSVESELPTELIIQTLYFPGWQGWVDGNKVELSQVPETGVISLPIDAGSHTIALEFRRTNVRKLADLISVTSLLLCLWLIWQKKYFHTF